MKKYAMLTVVVAAAAAISIVATDASAVSPSRIAKKPLTRSAPHFALQHRGPVARWEFWRGAAPAYGANQPSPVYHGTGYTYVPGRGIIDEACNLPTSACSNDQRDVQ